MDDVGDMGGLRSAPFFFLPPVVFGGMRGGACVGERGGGGGGGGGSTTGGAVVGSPQSSIPDTMIDSRDVPMPFGTPPSEPLADRSFAALLAFKRRASYRADISARLIRR